MKKFIAILLSALMMAQAAFAVCAADAENQDGAVQIHVSPKGSDANAGTVDKPVATFDKARRLVRSIRADVQKPVEVIFHEGTYRISETINFGEKDSGTQNAPIRYKAAEGEKVVFKGSKLLDTKAFREVTDPAVLKRLPDSAKGHIGVMDLREQGINTIGEVPYYRSGAKAAVGYHQLFFDDAAQTLARFPNSGYTTIKEITNAASKTFRMAEYNIMRWGEAKDVRVAGYFINDYNIMPQVATEINPKERTIKINLDGSISGANRRYYVYNLLEELDMPGEWYIDQENLLLYYYPQTRISNETLELSVLSAPMAVLSNVHYVSFEGLEFAQMRMDAFQLPSCTDITFDRCVFEDIGRMAIRDFSDLYRQYQKTPNSYNIVVRDSIFKNIGYTTIALQGGSEENLEESGNLVENCYFSGIGTEIISYAPAVSVAGVGITVKNCTMHNAGAHIISGGGTLHKIQNNEIFDSCKEVHDAGAIYAGRNLYQRGVDVSYNYLHHVKSLDKSIGEIACGVYMDDRLSEWYIHHNIFDSMSRGVFMNTGNDTEIHDNIFINNDVGVRISGAKGQWQELYDNTDEWVALHPIYLEKFPKIANLREPVSMAHDNTVADNLFVNSVKEIPQYEGDASLANRDVNNYMTEDFADFKDAENGNYEIKENAEILKTHSGLGEIKLENIGVSKDMLKKAQEVLGKDIVRMYPQNGAENINSALTEFKWSKSDIYDKYRIVIATDSKMQNVVADELVSYNYYSTDKLDAGIKTYYWTVTGVDISKERLPDLPSVGEPYKLMTAKYEAGNQTDLTEKLKKANEMISGLSEGDGVGQCPEGTLADFRSVIDKATKVNNTKYASQAEIDSAAEELSQKEKQVTVLRKPGYLSIAEYLEDQDGWVAGEPTYQNGIMHVEGSEWGYYEGKELPGYQLLKFKMKANFAGEWTGFGLRQQAPGMAYGVGGVGYMIIIKEDTIEFQRYNSGGGLLKEIKNDCIKVGEWHEYEVGAIDVEGGIRVIMRVDGKTILNELDTDGVITKQGHFQVYNRIYDAANITNGFDLAVSDDTQTELDSSIITGKLAAQKPEYADGFEKLFADTSKIQTQNGDYTYENGVLTFKKNSGTEFGEIHGGELNGGEVLHTKVKFNVSEGTQGFAVRVSENRTSPEETESYLFKISKDYVTLTRIAENGRAVLAVLPNTYIASGEFADLTFGAYPTAKGMRIMLYSGGNKIVDYTDAYSKHASSGISFYDINGRGIEFKK